MSLIIQIKGMICKKQIYKRFEFLIFIFSNFAPLRLCGCESFRLGETDLTVSEFLSIKSGDVLFLQHSADEPIDIEIGNLRLFKGSTVKKDNVRAVHIVKINHLNG